MSELRFMLDEHVDRAVATELRRREVEAQTVHELGRRGAADEEHLRWANASGWVVVTGDRDYLRLAREGIEHAGIAFYVRRRDEVGFVIRGLLELHRHETTASARNQVLYL